MKVTEINCHLCGKLFCRPTKEVTRSAKRGRLQFCSRGHQASYNNTVSHPGTSSSNLRKKAREIWIERNGGQLPFCWCGKKADIHHDDGDPKNNSEENHVPLCRSHHVALENKRFPRKRRKTHVEGCLFNRQDAGSLPAISTNPF